MGEKDDERPSKRRGGEARRADLIMDLRANGSREARISKGDPVVFTFTIPRPRARGREHAEVAARLSVGSEARPWWSRLELETLGGDGEGSAWRLASWAVVVFSHTPAEPMATIVASRPLTAEVDLAPSETARIPAGSLRIRGILRVGEGDGPPVYHSNAIALTVEEHRDRPPGPEEALSIGRYYLTRSAPDVALETAASLLQVDPTMIGALLLKADAQEANGDLTGALATFRKAEEEFHAQGLDQHEGPRYIRKREVEIFNKLKRLGRPV